MASSKFTLWIIIALVAFIGPQPGATFEDICSKFNIGGPCDLIPSRSAMTTTTAPTTAAPAYSLYCTLVCSQENRELLNFVCPCQATVATETTLLSTTALTTTTATESTTPLTTTTIPTTTPRPITCYYSSRRPARLNGISKRVYAGSVVTPECDYPGVVGLFYYDSIFYLLCMATVLEEDLLLINDDCAFWVNQVVDMQITVYALTDSYKTDKMTMAVTVDATSMKKLEPELDSKGLVTIRLNSPLTFNGKCIEPICVPNINMPASDIDFNDCRIPGYGINSTDEEIYPNQLLEAKVSVDPSSVNERYLIVTREVNGPAMACMGDTAAPLICSHKFTQEWVTVGISVAFSSPCDVNTGITMTDVLNLLNEATDKTIYNEMQKFKYADPRVFTTTMAPVTQP